MTLGLNRLPEYDRLDLTEKEHEVIVREVAEGHQAICDFIWCSFNETFETKDEATDAATGHETVME